MKTRVKVEIDTKNCPFPLHRVKYWNDESDDDAWSTPPPERIEPGQVAELTFGGNDRAGCIYETQDNTLRPVVVKMAFTCPRSSGNSAEGNAPAGLQPYEDHGTPAKFTYAILGWAKADWDDGTAHESPQTPDNVRLPDVPVYHQ